MSGRKKQIICDKWKSMLLVNFQDANQLRSNDTYCDLTFHYPDGKVVKAHKIILHLACPFFKELLSSENEDGSIAALQHIPENILEKIITFIYTGELELDLQNGEIEEIIRCAHDFWLEELFAKCIDLMSELIDDSNCIKYWRLSRDCMSREIEELCISHVMSAIKRNNIDDVKRVFCRLSKREIQKILSDSRLEWSEENKFESILQWTKSKTRTKNEFKKNFVKLLHLIDVTSMSKNFIFSNIIRNDDLLEHPDILKTIANLSEEKKTTTVVNAASASIPGPSRMSSSSNTNESSNRATKIEKIFTIINNEMKTVSDDGEVIAFGTIPKDFPDYFGYTKFNNFLQICGGYNRSNRKVLRCCECFDPVKMEWKSLPSMQTPRLHHECVFLEGKIYVCGGITSCLDVAANSMTSLNLNELLIMEIFDTGTEKWSFAESMKKSRYDFGFVTLNRSLYMLGGYDSSNVEMLDPRTSSEWSEIHEGFELEKITRCVPINNDIYCFRTSEIPRVFDTRKCTFREWKRRNHYKTSNSDFRVCYLNEFFNVIQYNIDNKCNLDFYKYNLEGNLINSKCNYIPGPIGALISLYDQSLLL